MLWGALVSDQSARCLETGLASGTNARPPAPLATRRRAERRLGELIGGDARGTRALRQAGGPRLSETPYSWLPGTGLNLIPRRATPMGTAVDASIVSAVQMMLTEVAAIAVVP